MSVAAQLPLAIRSWSAGVDCSTIGLSDLREVALDTISKLSGKCGDLSELFVENFLGRDDAVKSSEREWKNQDLIKASIDLYTKSHNTT